MLACAEVIVLNDESGICYQFEINFHHKMPFPLANDKAWITSIILQHVKLFSTRMIVSMQHLRLHQAFASNFWSIIKWRNYKSIAVFWVSKRTQPLHARKYAHTHTHTHTYNNILSDVAFRATWRSSFIWLFHSLIEYLSAIQHRKQTAIKGNLFGQTERNFNPP